jgi:hypothetical protein
MLSSQFSEIQTSEGTLHGVDIWTVLQLFVKRDSGGGFLCLLIAES